MENNLLKKLAKDTKIVATARFNKSKRLTKKTWWSLFSISTLSIVLIILAIFEKVGNLNCINPLYFFTSDIKFPIWVFTIVSSIIILAISIALSSSRLDVLYEKMHDSAIKINSLSRNIESKIENEKKGLYENLLHKYQKIISENPINHDDIDYEIAKSEINKNKNFAYYFRKKFYQHVEVVPYIFISFISINVTFSAFNKMLG